MKVLFILQTSSHARYWRRIDKLTDLGIQSKVFAFERDSFYKGTKDTRQYTSLEIIEHENYVKRIVPLIKSIKLIKESCKHVDVVYVFGLDTFLVGWFANLLKHNKPKFIYEVGDIRKVFTNDGIKAKIFRTIERYILKRTDLLVVTSEAYWDGYFKNIQKCREVRYHVIENKPELDPKAQEVKISNNDHKIRIGYFGVIRCTRALEVLKSLVTTHSDKFELYIRGVISQGQDLVNEMAMMANVIVEGEYKVPADLPSMYNRVDIIWACYPFMGEKVGNWMWARTTRFYEACYFNKAMITLKGSQDARYVKEKGIGVEVDLSDIDSAVKFLAKLDLRKIKEMQNNFSRVSQDVFTYSDEHQRLIAKIL